MANLLRASGLRLVQSPVIPFDTPGLEDGIRFAYVHAGTLVYDVGLFVPTAFDGTTPLADIGLYQGGDVLGFWMAGNVPVDLTLQDVAAGSLNGFLVMSQFSLAGLAISGNAPGLIPLRVTTAGPLYVVASQDATKGGTAVGGAAGELVAWALLAG